MKAKQLMIVTNLPFSEWVKRKEALAFIDLQKNEDSFAYRLLATSRQIMVFTEKETVSLFLQAIGKKSLHVLSIQDWYEKKKQREKAIMR